MSSHPEPGAPQTREKQYNPHRRSSRFRMRAPGAGLSALGVLALSVVLAFLAFLPPVGWPVPAWGTGAGILVGWSLFAIPLLAGAFITYPLGQGAQASFTLRRSLFLALTSAAVFTGMLILWRLGSMALGYLSVEGVLLLGFSVTFWFRLIVLEPLLEGRRSYALLVGLVTPLLGMAGTFGLEGLTLLRVAEAVLFLALSFLAAAAVLWVTDRPMRREFGTGGVTLLQPLMAHMNHRDPQGQARMEAFFESVSIEEDLRLDLVYFETEGNAPVVLVAPSVHPGPFAALGSSDLPAKLARGLGDGKGLRVLVPHSPSTHDQDIPTTAELEKVVRTARELLPDLSAGGTRASPLVEPRPGSLVRAQVLGDAVLLVLTQAPAPTDDIDYALAELLREEASRLGLSRVAILDAHNSFVEHHGDVPFGSPTGFRILEDGKAALRQAIAETREGTIRVGLGAKGGFTPELDGIAGEGLKVLVVEAAGRRTAYALFDANNLYQGLRDPLVRVMRESVEDAEVFTTDNHVVHEVRGAVNTLGERRSLEELSQDLRETLRAALADLRPARVRAAGRRIGPVKVLGPGTTDRLMTSLADSFLLFGVYFPVSLLTLLLAGTLVLAWFR